jgi:FMN phosphatase YigB (HAD superfamily)
VLSDFGVESSEAVFLDDLAQNIEGAKAIGIRTIHVTDFSAMVTGLDEWGLLR